MKLKEQCPIFLTLLRVSRKRLPTLEACSRTFVSGLTSLASLVHRPSVPKLRRCGNPLDNWPEVVDGCKLDFRSSILCVRRPLPEP